MTLDRLLAPGGIVSIQAITMAHERVLPPGALRVDPEVHLPWWSDPVPARIEDTLLPHDVARGATPGAAVSTTHAPAAVAGTVRRTVAPDGPAWLRRDVQPDVAVLPRLLGGRFPKRLPGRQPATADAGIRVELRGKVVWVVGASSGIGAATAGELRSHEARRSRYPPVGRSSSTEVSGGTHARRPPTSPMPTSSRRLQQPGPRRARSDRRRHAGRGLLESDAASTWDTEVFDRHMQVNLVGMSNAIAAVLPEMLARRSWRHRGHLVGGRLPRPAGAEATARRRRRRSTSSSRCGSTSRSRSAGHHDLPGLRPHRAHRRQQLPDAVHHRRRPGGQSICDGLEHDRTEIVFPWQMALLMKAARLVPVGLWARMWSGAT